LNSGASGRREPASGLDRLRGSVASAMCAQIPIGTPRGARWVLGLPARRGRLLRATDLLVLLVYLLVAELLWHAAAGKGQDRILVAVPAGAAAAVSSSSALGRLATLPAVLPTTWCSHPGPGPWQPAPAATLNIHRIGPSGRQRAARCRSSQRLILRPSALHARRLSTTACHGINTPGEQVSSALQARSAASCRLRGKRGQATGASRLQIIHIVAFASQNEQYNAPRYHPAHPHHRQRAPSAACSRSASFGA
jgi:hypothetical protein